MKKDSDDDGLDDRSEVEIGTDPTRVDTDSDGIQDAREAEFLRTDPAAAYSDGDGLSDSDEINSYETDPRDADSDSDMLSNGVEIRVHHTDQNNAEVDGDRLLDGWEVNGHTPSGVDPSNADPERMDHYVQFNHGGEVEERGSRFKQRVRDHFAEMPVENPGGSTGIKLHVKPEGSLGAVPTYDRTKIQEIARRSREDLGGRAGVYHSATFVYFKPGMLTAVSGESPGHYVIIDGSLDEGVVASVLAHELLHNVLGRRDAHGRCEGDPHHYCDGGWMTPTYRSSVYNYLPEGLAQERDENGFEE